MMKDQPFDDQDYDRILQMQDFFPKIFLQPSQIRLDKQAGLKIIRRYPNQPDKYEEEDIKPILVDEKQIQKYTIDPQRDEYGQIQHPAGDGLLSLFKRTKDRRIKLAICICVYSQSKHMLKTTIKGIQESNKDFLQKAGIMSHETIVIVIFDGLQNINASKDQTQNMISFFNQIDIKNGFRQRSNSLSLDDFLKQIEQNKIDLNNFNDDKIGQINLFTEDQLSQLQPKLFQNQYNLYLKTKKLLKSIEKFKLQKEFKLDLLPYDVVKKYQELCVNFCAENNYWFQTQQEIQEYLNGPRKNIRFRLIYEALCEVQDLCVRYLQSRQDKILLYPVRMEKDYLKNPRLQQNIQDQFSSLIDQSQKKEYNYLFLCVKHKNQGKLNSHMIFFQGFCKLFDPVYCILTDVGVKPQKDAIFKIYKHFELNQKCGGVCGYMSLKIQNPSDQYGYRVDGYDQDQVDFVTRCLNYFVSVQRAQQFEYHYAHMLDKPFESCFNYIHVLPGAFSGYRWKALKSVRFNRNSKEQDEKYQINSQRYLNYAQNDEQSQEETLLKKYLKTALMTQNSELTLEQSNMYLAEDRILCLGIHALGYDLSYLPDVESYVDPVTSLTKLLGQRRRWINGSWFAFNYVRQNSYQIKSIVFMVQLLYYSLVQKLQWIGPALFYLAMNLTLISFVTNNVVPAIQRFFKLEQNFQLSYYTVLYVFNIKQVLLSIPDIINYAYIISMMGITLWSAMSNHNNAKFKSIYYGASTLIGIYGILVLALLIYNTVQIIQATSTQNINENQQFLLPLIYLRALILFVIVGFALPILWTFSFKKSIQMITCLFSYIYFTPTYINILQIFAFTRVDDLSWGTKGLDKQSQNNISSDWQKRKYYFILQYITTNVLVAYLLVSISKFDLTKNIIILSTTILGVFLLAFRLIFAAIYLIKYYLVKCCQKLDIESVNQNRKNGYKIYNALKLIQLKIKQIEKERTKKKKVQEFKSLASMTSIILSKALSNFGKKIRNKVAKHIVSNSLFPKKELMDPFKKRLKSKKNSLIKGKIQSKIKTLNTLNSISSNPSKGQKQQIDPIVEEQQNDSFPQKNKQPVIPERNNNNGDKKQIKSILKSIRQRYKNKIK